MKYKLGSFENTVFGCITCEATMLKLGNPEQYNDWIRTIGVYEAVGMYAMDTAKAYNTISRYISAPEFYSAKQTARWFDLL